MNGHIYLLIGKSSSGKDRMYRELLSDDELKLKKVVLYTTRPMRTGEEDGKQYFFTDEEGYRRFKENGDIIEERTYQTMAGPWRYFTADDGQINLKESDFLMIGTPESAVSLKGNFGDGAVMPLYIETDDGLRLKRALDREMKQEKPRYDEMCRRFLADMEDFSDKELERAGVKERFENNGKPGECLAVLKNFIITHRP